LQRGREFNQEEDQKTKVTHVVLLHLFKKLFFKNNFNVLILNIIKKNILIYFFKKKYFNKKPLTQILNKLLKHLTTPQEKKMHHMISDL